MVNEGKTHFTLSSVIQRKNEIVDQLKLNYSKLKLNSQGKCFKKIDKEKILLQQKDLREKLVKIKMVISKNNLSINEDIYKLSELKVFLSELKMTGLSKFDNEIKETETEIERLETSLKKHNESVQVAWFNLIGINPQSLII